MSEKLLSESEWKRFAKGRDLKDAALLKAFAAVEKVAKAPPGEQVEPLEELSKQAGKLKDANAKDKDVSKQLGDIVAAATREIAKLEKEAKEAEKQAAKGGDGGDDEEDSPTALSTGLVTLLRQVRKGVPMQAMLLSIGKRMAVMLARRAISPGRRKVLIDYLDEKGSPKVFTCSCIFEENTITFVLATQAAGMAKKVKAALLEQTGQRFKVRVRGEDPSDIDDDDGGDGEDGDSPDGEAPDAAAKAAFDARLARLQPQLDLALKSPQRSDLTRLRAVSGFAHEKAAGGDWAAAMKALELLATLLAATPGTSAPQEAPPKDDRVGDRGVDPAAAFNARLAALLPKVREAMAAGRAPDARAKVAQAGALAKSRDYEGGHALLDEIEAALAAPAGKPVASVVQLQKSRLDWDSQRKSMQAQLQALERELRAAVKAHNADETAEDEIEEGDLADGIGRLYALLDKLDERLIDKLDDALNAEGERRAALQGEAATIVREYQAFVDSDPLMADIDNNGFATVSIRADTQRTLAALAQQL